MAVIRLPRMCAEDESSIHIRAYDEPTFPPLTLVALWQRIQDEKMTSAVWRDGTMLSLNQFIRFYSLTENRLLFLPFYQPDENGPLLIESIMGMLWLDKFCQPEGRAYGHFAFFKKWWGGWPEAVMRKALREWLFVPPLSLNMILCQGNVDNAKASALWDRLGIHRVGVVPNWYLHADGAHSAEFGYILATDYVEVSYDKQPNALGLSRQHRDDATEETESPRLSGFA